MLGKFLDHLRGMSGYNKRGEEVPDPKPGALKIDVEAELPLEIKVMRAIRSEEWDRRRQAEGVETFEEANDFDIDDELPEFRSIHEDESGDVVAYEEGVRSGFIEPLSEEKIEASRDIRAKAEELIEEKEYQKELAREKRRAKAKAGLGGTP